MRYHVLLLVFVALFFGQADAQSKPKSVEIKPPTHEEKREAERAWEALIKVKGGREKLHSIHNLLTKTKSYKFEKFGPYTQLDVFPNVLWRFAYLPDSRANRRSDRRPSVGLIDISKGWSYFANESGIYHRWRPVNIRRKIATERLAFLLETKWDRPEIVRVVRVFRDRKAYDSIQTTFAGSRIDFIYDPEDMLVREVDFHEAEGPKPGTILLSDYTVIDGIQMPRTYGIKSESFNKTPKDNVEPKLFGIEFEFNVDFNPDIFKGVHIRAGSPDDWKAKKTKTQKNR